MQDLGTLTPVEIRGHILPQLGIVRARKGMRHFTRVIPVSSGYAITSLCGQTINKYRAEGCLFQPFMQKFDIHHAPDFCQGCKKIFRNTPGIRFGRLLTFMMPERYPGCPINERFAMVFIEPEGTTDGMRAKQAPRAGPPTLRGYLTKKIQNDSAQLDLSATNIVFWDLQTGTSSLD